MRINTNLDAFTAQRNLSVTSMSYSKSVQKLSSGLRINSAADDAAGLSISEKLRAQIKGLAQAQRNAQDGISLIQTAEGALNETHSILQRMRELGVQGANGTLSSDDKTAIVSELTALGKEIDRISTVTDFNGTKLLSGGATTSLTPASVGALTQSNVSGDTAAVSGTFTGTAITAYSVKATAVATTLSAVATSGTTTATVAGSLATSASSGNFAVKVGAGGTTVTFSTDGGASYGGPLAVSGGVANLCNGVSITLGGTVAATDVLTFTGANHATKIQYSTDNGATYNGSDITLASNAGSVANGLTFTLTPSTTKGVALNDTYIFAATPPTAVLAAKTVALQIGANTTASEQLTVSIAATGSTNIGTVSGGAATLSGAVSTVSSSLTSADFLHLVDSVDQAQKDVSKIRGDLGANQNRLEHTIANLGVSQENLTASESRIRDVDMAAEMANFTKTGILQQAGQAILAQATQSSAGVMALLR